MRALDGRGGRCGNSNDANVLRDFGLIVDDFSERNPRDGDNTYFLTHFHADHYAGVAGFCGGPIYCSHMTRTLLLSRFELSSHAVVGCNLLETIEVRHRGQIVRVIMVDARHCSGSVMIRFESDVFGTVLHTGDFRYECHDPLPNVLLNSRISTVIYDATFCITSCSIFPTRDDSIQNVMRVLNNHRSSPRDIKVYIACQVLGAERVLQKVLSFLLDHTDQSDVESRKVLYIERQTIPNLIKEQIVSDQCLDNFAGNLSRKCCEMIDALKEYLTDDRDRARLFVMSPMGFEEEAVRRCNLDPLLVDQCIFIKVTTQWFVHNKILNQVSCTSKRGVVHHILYSMHSSLSEVKRFLNELTPSVAVPFNSPHSSTTFNDEFYFMMSKFVYSGPRLQNSESAAYQDQVHRRFQETLNKIAESQASSQSTLVPLTYKRWRSMLLKDHRVFISPNHLELPLRDELLSIVFRLKGRIVRQLKDADVTLIDIRAPRSNILFHQVVVRACSSIVAGRRKIPLYIMEVGALLKHCREDLCLTVSDCAECNDVILWRSNAFSSTFIEQISNPSV